MEWKTAHTADTDATPHAVWEALRAVHSGEVRTESGDVFEMHGPYAVGTELSVTPAGQGTFRSTIVELEDGVVYADQTTFGPLTLTFRHRFEPLAGGARVTHELTIAGDADAAEIAGLGAQISEDFPAAMDELFEIAGGAGAVDGVR